MRKIITLILTTFLILNLFVSASFAKVGVGVGLGKINIDEPLAPGGIYNLPSLPVLNTGDEDGTYEVEVTFLEGQEEFRPEADWFEFSPQSFELSGGESQTVESVLTLPVDMRPGDYFAFLEAHPVATGEGVTIGVAAASKLNFTVKPSGILGATIERARSLVEENKTLTLSVAGIVIGFTVVTLIKNNLDINIGRKKKVKEDKE